MRSKFPEAFLQRIRSQQYLNHDSLITGLSAPGPVSVRVNRHKLKSDPVHADPVPWCRSGFYLETRPSFTLDPLFHAGCYYPQEASSMFHGEVFCQVAGQKKNLKVLDLCGAPGGKSTHLSSLIGRNGLLVANEVIGPRAAVLAENLTKWGLSNTIVTRSDPSAFARLPGFFDIILVDVPCSGEGMFSDDEVVKQWSVENAVLCSERQKRILMDVWPSLKESGFLIYSTCTFNPDENEENIRWLLQNRDTEPVRIDIADYKGIKEIEYQGIYGYGFYPGSIKGEGLFLSVVKKTSDADGKRMKIRNLKGPAVSKYEKEKSGEFYDFSDESLIKTGDEIISVPGTVNDYSLLSQNLRIIKHGTKLFSVRGKDYIPSHELAMSVYSKINVFNTFNIDYEQALRYLRRENLLIPGTLSGWTLMQYNGVNLGFIKNIGTRINNYYPVDWRIKMSPSKYAGKSIIEWSEENNF